MSLHHNYGFSVVEFHDGMHIVSERWIIDQDYCYWPPITNTLLYTKYVVDHVEPKETWISYKIKTLGTYQDYETAKRKLKIAEDTSDLNTTDQDVEKKKRKIKRRKIDTSDEEEISDKENFVKIKRFPPPPGIGSASKTQQECLTPSTGRNTPCSSVKSTLSEDDYFKDKIFKELNAIKLKLTKLQQSIESNNSTKAADCDIEMNQTDILENFPINNIEELEIIENKLKETETFKLNLISALSRIGGCKVDVITKLILKRLFTDKFAAMFSWVGGKKKKIFSDLKLSDVILKSVRSSPGGSAFTEKDVIDSIKNWLRHASTRSQNQEKRMSSISANNKSDSEKNVD